MLQFFPFVAYLAVVTSLTLLVILWSSGDVGERQGIVLAVWLLVAGYCQFAGDSLATTAAGLGLQTILALYLILYWKLRG